MKRAILFYYSVYFSQFQFCKSSFVWLKSSELNSRGKVVSLYKATKNIKKISTTLLLKRQFPLMNDFFLFKLILQIES